MSKVINIKKFNLRKLGYNDLEHWLENPNHIYIGRNNPYVNGANSSKWKNTFSVKKYGRESFIKKFKKYLYKSKLIADIGELEGKVLGCWCKPEGCHGDVLVHALSNYLAKKNSI